MRKVFDFYELAGNDEESAFNIDISEEMSVDDVMNKILEVLDNLKLNWKDTVLCILVRMKSFSIFF